MRPQDAWLAFGLVMAGFGALVASLGVALERSNIWDGFSLDVMPPSDFPECHAASNRATCLAAGCNYFGHRPMRACSTEGCVQMGLNGTVVCVKDAWCERVHPEALVRTRANTYSALCFAAAGAFMVVCALCDRSAGGGGQPNLLRRYWWLSLIDGSANLAHAFGVFWYHGCLCTVGGQMDTGGMDASVLFNAVYLLILVHLHLAKHDAGSPAETALVKRYFAVYSVLVVLAYAQFPEGIVGILFVFGIFGGLAIGGVHYALVARSERGSKDMHPILLLAAMVLLAVGISFWVDEFYHQRCTITDRAAAVQPHALWHGATAGALFSAYAYARAMGDGSVRAALLLERGGGAYAARETNDASLETELVPAAPGSPKVTGLVKLTLAVLFLAGGMAEKVVPVHAPSWDEHPPMKERTPLENKSPLNLEAPGPPIPRIPADMGLPLWGAEHRPKANVVMGLALNYQEKDHMRFAGTLRRAGYTGDIVIATQMENRMARTTRQYLQDMRVICYPFNPICNTTGSSIKHKTCHWHKDHAPLPLAIIRHELYLSFAAHYDAEALFYVADYRDTFFQSNPFANANYAPGQLHVYAEHWPFKKLGNCPFNGGWVKDCWGKEVYESMKDKSALCSGSYSGPRDAIVHFETSFLNEVAAADCHNKGVPSDQGYLNKMFYSNQLPLAVVQERGFGIVNTVGCMDGSRPRKEGYLPADHVALGAYWGIVDAEGWILQNDGTRSPVVHQWDRFYKELREHVDLTLKCGGGGNCFEYEAALMEADALAEDEE